MKIFADWDDRLDDVAAGAAPDEGFTAHIRLCPACAAELMRRQTLLTRIDEVAREWMGIETSADIAGRLPRAALLGAPAPRMPRWSTTLAPMAAAVACAFAIFFAISRELPARTPPNATIVTWQSPTAQLLRPTVSVLNIEKIPGGERAF